MKNNIKIIIVSCVIIVLIVLGMYYYYAGREFKLYEEAQTLEAAGDVLGAHDKVMEALKINPSNRKIIAYKAKLYFIVENTRLVNEATKLRDDAVLAMERGDYIRAAEKIDKALENVDKVAISSPEYQKAMALQNKLIGDAERVTKEAPEKYYAKAKEHYNSGQYERAFEVVDYIIKPDVKIKQFKDELAMILGDTDYNKVMNTKSPDLFNLRSGIAWYGKVSATSPDKTKAKERSTKLKELLESITNK